MECVKYGHEIIGLAHLFPQENGSKSTAEIDSFMFQSVGSNLVESIASCMDVPLWTAAIAGKPNTTDLMYNTAVDGDEVEDMYQLLLQVKIVQKEVPDLEGVCSGAILSSYQRNRVENVCHRLQLTSLTYLWQQDQQELLERMIQNRVHAIIIKVAAIGLDPTRHLGKSLQEIQPELLRLKEKYQLNVCGEGGEYETLTLDCPLFRKRIVINSSRIVMHSDDFCAPVAYLVIEESSLEDKYLLNPLLKPPISSNDPQSPDEIQDIRQLESAHSDDITAATTFRDQIHVRGLVSRLPISSIQEDMSDIFNQLRDILQERQACLQDICFIHLYLQNMNTFAAVNHEYSNHIFTWQPPSRSCVECKDLTVKVLLDCFAVRGSGAARIDPTQSVVQVLHVRSISAWAPSCIGPYSQATTVHRSLILLAGQIPLNPATMQLIGGNYQEQSRQCIQNANAVLRVLDSNVKNVISAIVYVVPNLQNDSDYVPTFPPLQGNVLQCELRSEHSDFQTPVLLIYVSKLPRESLVEVELTALTRTAFDTLCPNTLQLEEKCNPYTFWYQIVTISRAVCLILAAVKCTERVAKDIDYVVSSLIEKIDDAILQAQLFWNQVLHLRIFYQRYNTIDQTKLVSALRISCKKKGLTVPAISLIPVSGIQNKAFLAIQVTALDIDILDTKMWLMDRVALCLNQSISTQRNAMRIHTCYFCSSPVYPGHGITFVRNDSKIFRFCRSKCHKNFNRKRNPRKVKWTKSFRKAAGKEMALDTTYDFEKQRNRVVKYDRDLMNATIHAMQRVQDIKQRRDQDFHKNRMKTGKVNERVRDLRELEQNISLIQPAVASKVNVQVNLNNAKERNAAQQESKQSSMLVDQ
ncbi:unnamed protein product [Albugo candida]|nr:unnamed protein product [Albugo candida]|eukprot:CCI44796.1 unnamed protein product [Albugo candida]